MSESIKVLERLLLEVSNVRAAQEKKIREATDLIEATKIALDNCIVREEHLKAAVEKLKG